MVSEGSSLAVVSGGGSLAAGQGLLPGVTSLVALPGVATPVTIQSMEFPRQEYWSGVPFPPPGDLPDPGIEPTSPALQADSLALSHHGSPKEPF